MNKKCWQILPQLRKPSGSSEEKVGHAATEIAFVNVRAVNEASLAV